METKTEMLQHPTLSYYFNIALLSPALDWKSEKPVPFAYPERFEGKVPLKVRLLKNVGPDILTKDMLLINNTFLLGNATIGKGAELYVYVNSYGAVSAILPNNKKLGLRPNEFEVIEYHSCNNA